jgi:hypothetical protein
MVETLPADAAVRGSDWTVGETLAHVTTALTRWSEMAGGAGVDVSRGRKFGPRMRVINRDEIDALGACAPDALVADGTPGS